MVKGGSAAQHVAKALRFARATRLLLADGLYDNAAAEAYYAVFHAAQALLAAAGQGGESHAAVHTLLARHFVRLGPLPRDFSQRFSHLMGDRLLADYGVDDQINQVSGPKAVGAAAALLGDTIEPLRSFVPEAAEAIGALAAEAGALAAAATPPPAGP
jgi:uncharacterized protein (UPF0332 family)